MLSSEEKWQRAEMEKRKVQEKLDAAKAKIAKHRSTHHALMFWLALFVFSVMALVLADKRLGKQPPFKPLVLSLPELDEERGVVWYTTKETLNVSMQEIERTTVAVLDHLPMPATGFRGEVSRPTHQNKEYSESTLKSGIEKHNAGRFDKMTKEEQEAVVEYATEVTDPNEVGRRLGLIKE